ncbi:hypothetical protein SMICM304S_05202 [Streptomyces microflavus]
MTHPSLTDREAVLHVLKVYREAGRASFLQDQGFSEASRFYVQFDGGLYDAKAIANAANRHQHGSRSLRVLSGGLAHSNRVLQQLGFTIVDSKPATVDGELAWRLAVWRHLNTAHDVSRLQPQVLRDFGAYGGGQGIWLDSRRTGLIHSGGIAMGVLHTGVHYPDDLGEHAVLYHYPNTGRQVGRDASEIAATKAAALLRLPIFVIAKPTPSSAVRSVRLAWVEGWEDQSEQFLITYGEEAPRRVLERDDSDGDPFEPIGNRRRRRHQEVQVRPDQGLSCVFFKGMGLGVH